MEKARAKQIELFYMPPYSPELNPDEYLNNTVKAQLRNQPATSSHEELKSRLNSTMQSNQRRPALIQKLLRYPCVVYAAR
jgi:transposase